jgi:hypothetical protein
MRLLAARSHPERTRTEEWTLSREGASDLRLRSAAGNVRVMAGDGERIRVTAVKKVRAAEEARASAFLERMRVDRRRDGDRWLVETSWPEPRAHDVESPRVNFEIRLPRSMRVEAQTGGGNMEATGIQEAHLRTNGGNIDATGIHGARLHTNGGNVSARDIRGRLDAYTGGGNIRVDGCEGPVAANTGGGNIEIRPAHSPVKATTGGGNIDVEVARAGGAVQVELGTGAGNIELRLPENVSGRLEAGTGTGRVEMDPPAGARVNKSRTHLETVLGDGQGSVRLRTGSGNVRIRLAGR